MFNMLTGKFIALMTPGVTFFSCAGPDITLLAMHKLLIRQASVASNIFCCKIFSIRKSALARNSSLVKIH
jgi:hypothetical protein